MVSSLILIFDLSGAGKVFGEIMGFWIWEDFVAVLWSGIGGGMWVGGLQ